MSDVLMKTIVEFLEERDLNKAEISLILRSQFAKKLKWNIKPTTTLYSVNELIAGMDMWNCPHINHEWISSDALEELNIHVYQLNLTLRGIRYTTIRSERFFDRQAVVEYILQTLGWSGITYAFSVATNIPHIDLVNECVTINMRHRTGGGKLTMYPHCFGEFTHKFLKVYEQKLSAAQRVSLDSTRIYVIEKL